MGLALAAAGAACGQDADPAESVVWKECTRVCSACAARTADNVVTLERPSGRRTGRRPGHDPVPVSTGQGALHRTDLADRRQQPVADRGGVPFHAGERPRRHRDAHSDRGIHACPCSGADERREAVHGRELRQASGGCSASAGKDALVPSPTSAKCAFASTSPQVPGSPRWRN